MEPASHHEPIYPITGEHLVEDMGDPLRVQVNKDLRTGGENTYINLGELGEHNVNDVRVRNRGERGFFTAYIRTREYAGEHKVITVTASTIAIGSVLTGLAALKHRKK